MDKLEGIIIKLESGKKKIQESIINDETKNQIIEDIDLVIKETKEIESLNSVKTEIRNQIVNPVKIEISKGNKLGWISIAAGISSMALSIFAIFIQPGQITKSQEEVAKKVINASYSNSINLIDSLVYKENGMFGIKNTKGERITNALYEKIEQAGDKYIKVRQFGKWGIIDSKGKIIIPTLYRSIATYNQKDYFIVGNIKRQFGICDTNHKFLIPMKYKYIGLNGEIAIFSIDRKKFGLLDINNNIIIEAKYDMIRSCTNKEFTFINGKYCGVINLDDQIIFKTIADDISCQSNNSGLSYQYIVNQKYGLISRDGKKLTEPKFDVLFKQKEYYDAIIFNELKEATEIRLDLRGTCLIGCEHLN